MQRYEQAGGDVLDYDPLGNLQTDGRNSHLSAAAQADAAAMSSLTISLHRSAYGMARRAHAGSIGASRVSWKRDIGREQSKKMAEQGAPPRMI